MVKHGGVTRSLGKASMSTTGYPNFVVYVRRRGESAKSALSRLALIQ